MENRSTTRREYCFISFTHTTNRHLAQAGRSLSAITYADVSDGTVDFTISRIVQGPYLPIINSLPLVSRLSQAKQKIHYHTRLHLNPDSSSKSQDGTPALFVTKAELRRREQAPLENLM